MSPNKKAGNYAPKELVAEHGGRDRRSRIAAIERTMEALFKRGELKSESDGPRSKGKLKLVVISETQNGEVSSCWLVSDLAVCVRMKTQGVTNWQFSRKPRSQGVCAKHPITLCFAGRFSAAREHKDESSVGA